MNSIKLDCIMDSLYDMGFENSGIFINPSYENAIVGVTDEGNVIYNYDKIAEWLVKNDNMSYIEAMEFIDTNVIPTIQYIPDPKPIIMYEILY